MNSLHEWVNKNYLELHLDYALYLNDMKEIIEDPLSFEEYVGVCEEYIDEIKNS